MKKIVIKKHNNLIWALTGLMMSGTLIDFTNVLTLLALGQKISIFETIIDAVCIFLICLDLPKIISKKFRFVCGSTLVFLTAWFFSGLIFPENTKYLLENSKQFFVYVLPYCWIGYYLNTENYLIKDFLKIGRVKLIISLITQILILRYPYVDIFEGDYMNAANALLVGLMCVSYLSFKEHKKTDIFLTVVGTATLLVSGSRNVFLAIVAFWCLMLLFSNKKRRGIYILTLIVFGISIVLFYQPIINFLYKLTAASGTSTHLLDALSSKTLFEDSERTQLYQGFLKAIKDSPIFGYGILGDRVISVTRHIYRKSMYPHNIVLELCVDFGMILGGILVFALFVGIIKGFCSKREMYRDTIIVLFCCSIVKLMFSSTFWNDQIFFFLIGFLISERKMAKRYRIEERQV